MLNEGGLLRLRYLGGFLLVGCLAGLWYLLVHPEAFTTASSLEIFAAPISLLRRSYVLGVWTVVALTYGIGLLLAPLTRRPAGTALSPTWWHIYALSAIVVAPCIAPLDPEQYGVLRNGLQLVLPLLCAGYGGHRLASHRRAAPRRSTLSEG